MKTVLLAFIYGEGSGFTRPKRSRSPHQRQMRFFTVLFSALTLAGFALLFCLINR